MLGISACASNKSQDALISAFPRVEESNIGSGKALSIRVNDDRSNRVIGRLGDGPDAAEITTSQNLAETIGVSLSDAFAKKGFRISSANDDSAIDVLVTLQELSYSLNRDTLSTDVETKSAANVVVQSKSFNRAYSNGLTRTIPFAPNEDSNNSQLSDTVTTLLEKIASDERLLDALKN